MFLSILKRFWREIIIAILVIVVALSASQCQKQKSDIALLNQIQDSTFNALQTVKEKNGELTTRINTYQVTEEQLKNNVAELGLNEKKLKSQIGSLTNLVTYYAAKIQLRDSFTVVNHDTTFITKGDTTRAKAFQWGNKYLAINGFTAPAYTTISYSYTVDFELKSYTKKTGFLGLGRSQLLTDLTFSDPNIQVKQFKGIVVQQPKKKWYETGIARYGAAAVVGYWIGRQ